MRLRPLLSDRAPFLRPARGSSSFFTFPPLPDCLSAEGQVSSSSVRRPQPHPCCTVAPLRLRFIFSDCVQEPPSTGWPCSPSLLIDMLLTINLVEEATSDSLMFLFLSICFHVTLRLVASGILEIRTLL
uniref:Uncharacterized protein n=1 Tax=Caenorhabditis tropicalis TaxID=1561998 RepID=A0A1I7URN3_9PELO